MRCDHNVKRQVLHLEILRALPLYMGTMLPNVVNTLFILQDVILLQLAGLYFYLEKVYFI